MRAAPLADRAARLHAAALASSDNGRPAAAVRQLRAGLRLIGAAADSGDPAVAEVRGRLLISLAWAESERGRVDVGFRLLDQAEQHITRAQRPVLLAQRGLLLKRSGRNDLALRQYDEAVALLTEASPLDLVKVLNNRSLVHLEAGHIRLARADLHRCGQVAARHGLALHAALSRVNLGCMDVVAGDLPSALGAFAAARADYRAAGAGAAGRASRWSGPGPWWRPACSPRPTASWPTRPSSPPRSGSATSTPTPWQVRAEAALLAGRAQAAAQWAREARARFLGRDNARRAALSSLLELRADLAAATLPAAAIAARGQSLARRLSLLGLAEDARVASLVAARALISAGRPARAARAAARYGPPGRVDRLDTRLLWRLARSELAAAAGQPAEASRHLLAGMAALHRHRTQFGCLDLQTGAAVHGQDLARAGLAAALARGAPDAVYRWSERARAQALLLPPARPPDDPAAAAALEELRQARHTLRAQELAGRPVTGLRARVEALQRSIREQSWTAPGQRDAPAPAPAALRAIRDSLAGAALVTYLRDGPVLRALVVTGDSVCLRTVGGYAAAEEAVLRLRADLDSQAGRALPGRLAAAVRSATSHDAAAVGSAVLSPLLADIGDRELVVVPTGVLMTVPWAALPGCAGRPVTVAPSATVWRDALRRRRTAGPVPAARGRARRPCWWPGRETPAATPRYGRSPRSAPAPPSSPGRPRHRPPPSPPSRGPPSPTSPRTASIRPRTRCSRPWSWPAARCSAMTCSGPGGHRSWSCSPPATWG